MANKIIKIFLIVLLISLIFLPKIFEENEEESSSGDYEMTYTLSQVTLSGHEDGDKQWMMQVNSVLDKGNDRTELCKIDYGEIYDEEGVAKYFLTADSGEYSRRTDLFTLQDNILVTTTDGEVMKTDVLEYDQTSKFLTTGTIEIKKKDMILNASEMQLDVDEEIYDFSGDVMVEFDIEDADEKNQEENGGVAE